MTTTKSAAESLLQAASTVVWVAAPDWSSTTRQRRAIRGVAVAISCATAAALVARTQREDPELIDEEPDVEPSWQRSVVMGSFAVGSLAAVVATHHNTQRLTERSVQSLERRGVRWPWTLVGLAWGLVTLGIDLAERRGVFQDGS